MNRRNGETGDEMKSFVFLFGAIAFAVITHFIAPGAGQAAFIANGMLLVILAWGEIVEG